MGQEQGLPVELFKLIPLFAPVDANGNIFCQFIDFSDYNHGTVLIATGVGTQTNTINLFQAKDNIGTSVKALNGSASVSGSAKLMHPFQYYGIAQPAIAAQATAAPTVANQDLLTKVTVPAASPFIFTAGAATTGATTRVANSFSIIEIDQQDFDINGGFNHFSLEVVAAGALLCCAVILLTRAGHPQGWSAADATGGPLSVLG